MVSFQLHSPSHLKQKATVLELFTRFHFRYAGVTLPDETDIAGCMKTRGLSNKVAQQKGMTSHFINVLVHKLIH